MSAKRQSRTLRLTPIALTLLALGACDNHVDPQPDFERIETVWSISAPPGTEVEEYYSSEVDFQGGRSDIYVLHIPESSRRDPWDPSSYTEGTPSIGNPSPEDIAESSGAQIPEETYDQLACEEPRREDQNYLVLCYHEQGDAFYVFEQLF